MSFKNNVRIECYKYRVNSIRKHLISFLFLLSFMIWIYFVHICVNILVCHYCITSSTLSGAVMDVIVWYLDLQLPVQSVPIATKVVSSSPVHGEVYSIQYYVIMFVSDLWQVADGFLRFPPPIKFTATI
jgi:hypothetical protein